MKMKYVLKQNLLLAQHSKQLLKKVASSPQGSYELVEKLWAQFVLTAGRVNSEVAWTRDEVVVRSVKSTESVRNNTSGKNCFVSPIISNQRLPTKQVNQKLINTLFIK